MIRPEARAALARWREVILGGLAAALGLFWIAGQQIGILHWLGYVIALGGAALIYTGVQRARFRRGGDGPGVVQVTERRVTYFGPLTGGVADLSDLERITLDGTGKPPHWVLEQPGQPPLAIPLSAQGAEALFDAFSALPGLRTEHMLRQIENPPVGKSVIWMRNSAQNTTKRLH